MKNPLRRSQAITPFGVGAIVDFPGPVSMIHAGLDAWPFDEDKKDGEHSEFVISDEKRLAKRLGVKYFVTPPDFRQIQKGISAVQNIDLKLPFLRFPQWHVCPYCGLMYKAALHDKDVLKCKGPDQKGNSHRALIPLQARFVAACEDGHLQDFPWWEWVLGKAQPDEKGYRLRMIATGSASLAGIKILCEKDSGPDITPICSRTLAGAFSYEFGGESSLSGIGVYCQGNNPALAIPSATSTTLGCGKPLYPLLKGGSNVYFPQVKSAIYIPYIPPESSGIDADVLEVLDLPRAWEYLEMMAGATENKVTVKAAQMVLERYFPQKNIDPQILADAANKKLAGPMDKKDSAASDVSEDISFLREEYTLFCQDTHDNYSQKDLLIRVQDMSQYSPYLRDTVCRISLLHKLRETRVFTGFTRLLPENNQTLEERKRMISRMPKDWLPAITVRGEGIFLVLSEEKLLAWQNVHGEKLTRRLETFGKKIKQKHNTQRIKSLQITPRFVLLHTLAHLLINQLIFECGYGSAALRERIYSSDDKKHPMAGILIYTAAGDSDGTMGGLVRTGNRGIFENIFQKALEKARWCSTDPVCMESRGQGPGNCNLAACHACALLPETSCENQNMFLDRGVLIGTIENPNIGFFSTGKC